MANQIHITPLSVSYGPFSGFFAHALHMRFAKMAEFTYLTVLCLRKGANESGDGRKFYLFQSIVRRHYPR